VAHGAGVLVALRNLRGALHRSQLLALSISRDLKTQIQHATVCDCIDFETIYAPGTENNEKPAQRISLMFVQGIKNGSLNKFQLLTDEYVRHFFFAAIRCGCPIEQEDWALLYADAAREVRVNNNTLGSA
jgi:hypothetical protein